MRHEMRHKGWACAGLACLLIFGLIPAGQAADNLSFKGNLVEEACTIRPGDEAITLQKGAEMGLFKLGSTVVCLFGPGMLAGFEPHLANGVTTRMGQPFAKLAEQA